MTNIFVVTTILLGVTLACSIFFLYKLRYESKHNKELSLLSDIMKISFESATLESSCLHLIDSMQDVYGFSYVTILLYDEILGSFNVAGSNCHRKFFPDLEAFALETYRDVHTANLLRAKIGSYLAYPSARLRDVKSSYFIPLVSSDKCVGAIIIEDKKAGCFEHLKIPFFLLIINNVSFVMQNIIYSEKIKQFNSRDSLTGTYNRRYMQERLPMYIQDYEANDGTFCLAVLDIDFFKNFNTSWGHSHGDWVLKNLSKMVQSKLRPSDELYRFGGEEFVIYSPGLYYDEAVDYYNSIRLAVESMRVSTIDTDESTPVRISLGYASYPMHSTSSDGLFKAADTALYYVKEHGRNNIKFYDPKDCKGVQRPDFKTK